MDIRRRHSSLPYRIKIELVDADVDAHAHEGASLERCDAWARGFFLYAEVSSFIGFATTGTRGYVSFTQRHGACEDCSGIRMR